jgi:hypothetical protein
LEELGFKIIFNEALIGPSFNMQTLDLDGLIEDKKDEGPQEKYPVLLGGGKFFVQGTLFVLEGGDDIKEIQALKVLDEIEGVAQGLYYRTSVTVMPPTSIKVAASYGAVVYKISPYLHKFLQDDPERIHLDTGEGNDLRLQIKSWKGDPS